MQLFFKEIQNHLFLETRQFLRFRFLNVPNKLAFYLELLELHCLKRLLLILPQKFHVEQYIRQRNNSSTQKKKARSFTKENFRINLMPSLIGKFLRGVVEYQVAKTQLSFWTLAVNKKLELKKVWVFFFLSVCVCVCVHARACLCRLKEGCLIPWSWSYRKF